MIITFLHCYSERGCEWCEVAWSLAGLSAESGDVSVVSQNHSVPSDEDEMLSEIELLECQACRLSLWTCSHRL